MARYKYIGQVPVLTVDVAAQWAAELAPGDVFDTPEGVDLNNPEMFELLPAEAEQEVAPDGR